MVFLSVEGVRLAQRGYADDIREEGFTPLRELMDGFVKAGGVKLVEFLSDGSPSVTF